MRNPKRDGVIRHEGRLGQARVGTCVRGSDEKRGRAVGEKGRRIRW